MLEQTYMPLNHRKLPAMEETQPFAVTPPLKGTRVTLYLIEISKLARKQKKNMSSQLHWCPSYVDEEKRAKLSFERAFLYYVPRNKQIGYKG